MSATYQRRCTGKRRHETRESAEGQRASLCRAHSLGPGVLDVYDCDQCLGFHVGRAKGRYISRRRRSGKRPNKRLRGRI